MPTATLMGEDSDTNRGNKNNRKRRSKFPSLKLLRRGASSLYRNKSSDVETPSSAVASTAAAAAATGQEECSWREKLSKWKISRSISQTIFKRSTTTARRKKRIGDCGDEEVTYSTDDEGGFRVWQKTILSPKKKRNEGKCGGSAGSVTVVHADIEYATARERPKSIGSLPVRSSEEIIVYYDDCCFTKSDSSLLSTKTYTVGDEQRELYGASSAAKKRYFSGNLLCGSCSNEVLGKYTATAAGAAIIPDQCYSADSLPEACMRRGRNSSSSSARRYSSSSSYETITRPSPVAYQPQVVSTPVVSSGRQLSTNPSRRPNDFPNALVVEHDLPQFKAGKRSPIINDYQFWLSYERLLRERRAGVPDSATKTYRNRLSLPIFSRSSKGSASRKVSARSSSLSSVYNLLTPSSLPTKAASLALQQLLNCYRTGDMTQEKVSLLLDILDTQEKFAKVGASLNTFLFK